MSAAEGALVVLGVGNELLRDDAVGLHVVRELARRAAAGEASLPEGTELLDGGTLGPDVLPWLAGARGLVLVDAVELDAAPGAVEVLVDDALDRGAAAASRDRDGIAALLATARLAGDLPRSVALVGVQPAAIDVGLEMTAPVRAAIPEAVEATLHAVRSMASPGPRPAAPAGSPGAVEPEVRS